MPSVAYRYAWRCFGRELLWGVDLSRTPKLGRFNSRRTLRNMCNVLQHTSCIGEEPDRGAVLEVALEKKWKARGSRTFIHHLQQVPANHLKPPHLAHAVGPRPRIVDVGSGNTSKGAEQVTGRSLGDQTPATRTKHVGLLDQAMWCVWKPDSHIHTPSGCYMLLQLRLQAHSFRRVHRRLKTRDPAHSSTPLGLFQTYET